MAKNKNKIKLKAKKVKAKKLVKIKKTKKVEKIVAQKKKPVLAHVGKVSEPPKEEKKRPARATPLDDDSLKDSFDEKASDEKFEKKILSEDDEAEDKDKDKDKEDWEDAEEGAEELGSETKKKDWQTPLPGRFDEEEDDV